ncbi:hypothetical protein LguiA_022484 [Lonicera macranthoides]
MEELLICRSDNSSNSTSMSTLRKTLTKLKISGPGLQGNMLKTILFNYLDHHVKTSLQALQDCGLLGLLAAVIQYSDQKVRFWIDTSSQAQSNKSIESRMDPKLLSMSPPSGEWFRDLVLQVGHSEIAHATVTFPGNNTLNS